MIIKRRTLALAIGAAIGAAAMPAIATVTTREPEPLTEEALLRMLREVWENAEQPDIIMTSPWKYEIAWKRGFIS